MKRQEKSRFKENRDELSATENRKKRKMAPPSKRKYKNPKFFLEEEPDDLELDLYEDEDEDLI